MPCAARVRPLLAAGFGPPSAAPAAWYLTSTPRFPGSGRPRSLWSARLPGAGYPLDHSLWRANAHNQAVPPPGARASAWGREPKPCWPSGQQATLMGSVGGWPSATLPVRSSGLAAAGNRPHGRDWRAGLLLLGGVCSGVWRPSWPDLSRGGPRPGELSGGNRIGRRRPCSVLRDGRLRPGGRPRAPPFLHGNANVPPPPGGLSVRLARAGFRIVTWLILPVVICLSQRLSHACLSISNYTVKLRMAH